MLVHEEVTQAILGAAIEVHSVLGPGLLEAVYEECLCRELALRHVPFVRQSGIHVSYKGSSVGLAYRVDLLVDDKVLVELKSVDTVFPIFEAKLMNCMRLSGKRVGLLINFNVTRLMPAGVLRRVL